VEIVTLEVRGMSCGGCEQRVRDAVGALAGVERVVPEHIGDEVEVSFDAARVDAGQIANVISALGFTVVAS
jgi:copper chaperone